MLILALGAACVNYCIALQPLLLAASAITLLCVVLLSQAPAADLWGHPIRIGGKVSGFFMERTREYYRKVDGSRHFLRKPPAITNDVAALNEAERLGADRVRIVDSETGSEYTCIIAIIRDYGFPIDRGYGRQIALPLGYWVKTAPDGTVTPPTLPKQPQPQPAAMTDQPMLFAFAEPARKGGAY